MKPLELLDIKQTNNNQSPEDYKKNVIEGMKLLVTLGIMDTPSTDLKTSVDFVIDKMRKNENILYGKELTKEDLMEQLQEVNSKIAALDDELGNFDNESEFEENLHLQLQKVNTELLRLNQELTDIDDQIMHEEAKIK